MQQALSLGFFQPKCSRSTEHHTITAAANAISRLKAVCMGNSDRPNASWCWAATPFRQRIRNEPHMSSNSARMALVVTLPILPPIIYCICSRKDEGSCLQLSSLRFDQCSSIRTAKHRSLKYPRLSHMEDLLVSPSTGHPISSSDFDRSFTTSMYWSLQPRESQYGENADERLCRTRQPQ